MSHLPTPRHSIETWADARYQLRLESFPMIRGFVAERNARGTISIPSQLLIENRNTLDTIFNFAVSPVVRFGNLHFSVTPGLQFTLRRDTLDPFNMDQNLFRQFLYVDLIHVSSQGQLPPLDGVRNENRRRTSA